MKRALDAWTWTLDVLARSPALILALAALAVVWGFGAYHWLGLAESSALLILLAVVWGLAQILIAVSAVGGVAASAAATTTRDARSVKWLSLLTFDRNHLIRAALLGLIAISLVFLVAEVFSWSEDLALRVASLLTFVSETAFSPIVIGKIFWVVKAALWVMLAGFLSSFLMILLRAGWKQAWRARRPLIRECCWRIPFLTGLLSLTVFGGLAYFLVTWHPTVTPGFWDYAQLALRMGGALLLLVIGWLFLMLSLARLILPPEEPAPIPNPGEAPAVSAPDVPPTP
ncbi:MAG: hypothetical protein HYS61_09265 [Acidobacteria bacterium]|nr:hypothetical protein [Acidobacteriota bacterium]